MPATWVGMVAAEPPAGRKIKPAVLKVVEQMFAAEQAVPLGQRWRGLVAAVCYPRA